MESEAPLPFRFSFPAQTLPVDSTVRFMYLPRLSVVFCGLSWGGPGDRGMGQWLAGRPGREARGAGREAPERGRPGISFQR